MLGDNFVEENGITSENLWSMDRPGPELTDPICTAQGFPYWPEVREGCGNHENDLDLWPVVGGDEMTDNMGRSVNVACCNKYDSALELLGTINITSIDAAWSIRCLRKWLGRLTPEVRLERCHADPIF